MHTFFQAVIIGTGATLFMDIWAWLQKRLFGIPSLDYRLVGRWIGNAISGRTTQATIMQAPALRGEVIAGWTAHYVIGMIFSYLLIRAAGNDWLHSPTLLPALICGIVSVAAPFFVMQPAFGLGIAASRVPKPRVARSRSLIAHLSFGIGIYLSAWLLNSF